MLKKIVSPLPKRVLRIKGMIITTIKEMQAFADVTRAAGKTIGLVPTMGYLHDGHASLIKIARQQADVVVTSIYVNPTQFGPNEDFAAYPRDLEGDKKTAYAAGCDVLFVPDDREMYGKTCLTTVQVKKLTDGLCGKSRPGHFEGVTTVVGKLFNIIKPHVAVFGQKDAQQALVIKRMVQDLNFDIRIIIAPIVREPDGLAMSSRNKYLSPAERQDALVLYRALQKAQSSIRNGETDAAIVIQAMTGMIAAIESARIDYVQIVDAETLETVNRIQGSVLVALAVFIGRTRLIDNIILNN